MAQPQLLWELFTNNVPLAITGGPGRTAGWRHIEADPAPSDSLTLTADQPPQKPVSRGREAWKDQRCALSVVCMLLRETRRENVN